MDGYHNFGLKILAYELLSRFVEQKPIGYEGDVDFYVAQRGVVVGICIGVTNVE